MPKFEVELCERVVYTVVVEAADEDEAADRAEEEWCQCDTPTETYNGRGLGVTTTDVTEKFDAPSQD
jgi:hypothetical protein